MLNYSDLEEYDVYDENGEYIGSVMLPENADMPKVIEINGFKYYIK